MSKYLDANGLVKGLIPAGQACPFLSKCNFKVHTCPGVEGKMKANNFSCAAARLHSMVEENKAHELPIMRRVLEKGFEEETPAPDPFTDNHDIVTDDDEGYTE